MTTSRPGLNNPKQQHIAEEDNDHQSRQRKTPSLKSSSASGGREIEREQAATGARALRIA